jgi:cytochrome P450
VLLSDPPDHTRLRGLVSRTFTPKRIESWEPRITAVANELIETMHAKNNPDVVADFTTKLPIYVIGEILGLPREKWDWLKTKSDMIATLLDPFLAFDPVVMNRHLDELRTYFQQIASQRRAEPRDDLISALVQAADGDALTDDEFVAMIEILMVLTKCIASHTRIVNSWWHDSPVVQRSVPSCCKHTFFTGDAESVSRKCSGSNDQEGRSVSEIEGRKD